MAQKELEAALKKLIQEIDKIDNTDEKTKESIGQLVNSIQLLINEPENKEQHSQLLEELKNTTIQFDVKHPLISNTLEELIDILVRLGI